MDSETEDRTASLIIRGTNSETEERTASGWTVKYKREQLQEGQETEERFAALIVSKGTNSETEERTASLIIEE